MPDLCVDKIALLASNMIPGGRVITAQDVSGAVCAAIEIYRSAEVNVQLQKEFDEIDAREAASTGSDS